MPLSERKSRSRNAILEALKTAALPQHSRAIAETIRSLGLDLSERSVRLYLETLEAEGLTLAHGRKGHSITAKGREELGSATLLERVGYMSSHVERMMFLMDFDLATRTGTVVVNVTLAPADLARRYVGPVSQVFEQGFAMGTQLGLLREGETLGRITVGPGYVGICTVCSITLSGILLKHGVPVRSLYCGLLDIEQGKARRVKELIAYEAISIDPLQLFINSGMTNYLGAIKDGNGRIGVGFREVPSESHGRVESIAAMVKKVGLGAFLQIGKPNLPLLNMPVHEGCCGVLVVGGLNPMAVFVESGHRVESLALCGLMDYHRLFHYSELKDRLG